MVANVRRCAGTNSGALRASPSRENVMQSLARLRTPVLSIAALSVALLACAVAFADQPGEKKGDTAAEAAAPAGATADAPHSDAHAADAPAKAATVTPEAKQ